MFTRGNRLLQPLPKWGEGDRLTQAPGTIAIFCKPICGLARGKHHRFQMSKSFPGQGGGKENPKPGTVATAEARSGFQCCLCLTVLRRGDDRQITLQWGGGGFWDPPVLGKSQRRVTLSIWREFIASGALACPRVNIQDQIGCLGMGMCR